VIARRLWAIHHAAHAGVVRALRVANGSDWPSAMAATVTHLSGEWIPAEKAATP
jgi:hypothetical protein